MTEIEKAGRTVAAGVVAFELTWDPEQASGSTIGLGLALTSPDSDEEVLLALGVRDGAVFEQHVTDQGSGRRHDVPLDADVHGTSVTARFPADQVGVAAEWPVWTAMLSVDGEQVAERRGT